MNLASIIQALLLVLISAIRTSIKCTLKLCTVCHFLNHLYSFITWDYFDLAKSVAKSRQQIPFYQNSRTILISLAALYLAIYLFGLLGLEKDFSVKNIFTLDYYCTSPYTFMHQIYPPNVWRVMDISMGVISFLCAAFSLSAYAFTSPIDPQFWILLDGPNQPGKFQPL